ncbi:MAG: hypothetical protein JSR60_11280 [Proteobacteria bacterium]|nr:hypothetical protein [Pseudomonadota bacterium]
MTGLQAVELFGFFAVWIALALFATASFVAFRARLEIAHPDVWRGLGSPKFSGGSLDARAALRRYLIRLRFRELRDQELSRSGIRALVGYALWPVWLVALALWARTL